MPSIINTGNIDTAYPIAGQDNDSQGFRDNFTNINDNFIAAKDEIEDLQDKVILKVALSGGTLDNDMTGVPLVGAEIRGFRGTVVNEGSVSGSVVIDVGSAPYHKLSTSGSIDLSFLNFAASGTHSEVILDIDVTSIGHTVTLPGPVAPAVDTGLDTIQGISGQVIKFAETGTYLFKISTTTAGSAMHIEDLSRARTFYRASAPVNSVGVAGDLKGMVANDGAYIYLCTADFDGVSNIWLRAAATTF